MSPMTTYTNLSNIQPQADVRPWIRIGQGPTAQLLTPNQTVNDSYWIVIMDPNKPATKVQEWVVPGQNNTTVPNNLDQYMSNLASLFAEVTQSLPNGQERQASFCYYP